MGSSPITFTEQLATLHMSEFRVDAKANPQLLDSINDENAGIVLAALAEDGDIERFGNLASVLANDVEYQASAFTHCLKHSAGQALSVITLAVDTIQPSSLAPQTRAGLMAAMCDGVKRSSPEETVELAWPTYKFDTATVFNELARSPETVPGMMAELCHIQHFGGHDTTDEYFDHITELATEFAQSDYGHQPAANGMGLIINGEIVSVGVLAGLHAVGALTQESTLLLALSEDPTYGRTVSDHIKELYKRNDVAAHELYDLVQPLRANLSNTQELDVARAQYQARNGDVNSALIYADTVPDYKARIWIRKYAAQYLYEHGGAEEASQVLEKAVDLDPLAVEPVGSYSEMESGFEVEIPETDDDDPDSVAHFLQEASIQYELTPKTTADLQADRAMWLEWLAVDAAKIGNFELALKAYGQSRKLGDRYPTEMAETAIKHGKIVEYIEAIIAGNFIQPEYADDVYRPSILKSAIDAYHQRADRFSADPTANTTQEAIAQLVREYVQSYLQRTKELDLGSGSKSYNMAKAMWLLLGVGDYEPAEEIVRETGGIYVTNYLSSKVAHMAFAGRVKEAFRLYKESTVIHDRHGADELMQTIILNSFLVGDIDIARAALFELEGDEYKRYRALGFVATHAGGQIHDVPDDILRLSIGPEKYKRTTDVRVVAEILQRAGKVAVQATEDPIGW